MIVLISENNYYVFKADEVKGIYNINKNIIKDTPATISKSSIVWTHGLIEINQMNIGLLDENKIFEGFNRSLT